MSVTAVSAARATDHPRHPGCVQAGNVTRSLLGYLALAGPFYVVVSLVQAMTRDGFSLVHDEWSLLAVGHLGWIQTVNLILTGVMTLTGAVGFRRAVGRSATAGVWAPRLLAGYGIALIGAGIFRADAADGFPPGTQPAARHKSAGTARCTCCPGRSASPA